MIDPVTQAVAQFVEQTFDQVLTPRLAKGKSASEAFLVWLRPDRVIVSVDPLAVRAIDDIMSRRFVHHLSTALQDRKVVLTNSRGVFFQISLRPQPPARLESKALDLSAQPDPLSVPLGETRAGPMWRQITEIAPALVGGSRGMGKSNLLHGWIQALIHGGRAQLYIWDGKENLEYGRYGQAGAAADAQLDRVLAPLLAEIARRKQILQDAGAPSVEHYNAGRTDPLPPLVLVVDECAFIPQASLPDIIDLVARGRAWGVYPVLATQRPGSEQVQALIKVNLTTRIAFAVPAWQDSKVILDRTGAEKLPNIPGRLMTILSGRRVLAQAYRVDLPAGLLSDGQPNAEELALGKRAHTETGDRLSIPLLVKWGLPEWRARKMLERLENDGWLIRGEANERYLSPLFLRLISQGSQALSRGLKGSQASQGGAL